MKAIDWILLAVILLIVGLALRSIRKRDKEGSSCCGGGRSASCSSCSSCASCPSCSGEKKTETD